jgi:hypothetical protein
VEHENHSAPFFGPRAGGLLCPEVSGGGVTCYVGELASKPCQFANDPRLITYHCMISRVSRSVLTDHLASRLSTSGVTSLDVAALVNIGQDHMICSSFMCDLSLNPYKSTAQSLCDLSLTSTSFDRVVDLSVCNIAILKATKSQ